MRSPNSWVTSLMYGRLAAAGARARELEQRLEHLRALDRVVGEQARGRAAGSTGRSPSARRSTSRCSATGSMLIALWRDLGLALGRADVDAHAAAGAVVGRDLDREPVAGQVLGPELLAAGSRPARRRPRRSGTPSCGSWRAGRRSRTCRSRCRSSGPRSGSPGRSRASRTARCRSGRCRRPGSALTGRRSPSPAISRAVTRRDEVGRVVGHRRGQSAASP